MTLLEMKKKVLELIEEINKSETSLTSDIDIAEKINTVINQVQFELARIKKIPTYSEEEVTADEPFDMTDLAQFYQLRTIRIKSEGEETPAVEIIDNLAIFSKDCTATFYYYKYPKVIDENTSDDYRFELSADALEVMPYGVAADILKSDVSANYGQVYSNRYETMLQRLDPRYAGGMFYIEGGIDV